jgi:hypothetical protein
MDMRFGTWNVNEVTGGWRKLHNEELHNLYSSPSMIRMIKSRRMRWAGHVARMGEKRNAYRILMGKPEGMKSIFAVFSGPKTFSVKVRFCSPTSVSCMCFISTRASIFFRDI